MHKDNIHLYLNRFEFLAKEEASLLAVVRIFDELPLTEIIDALDSALETVSAQFKFLIETYVQAKVFFEDFNAKEQANKAFKKFHRQFVLFPQQKTAEDLIENLMLHKKSLSELGFSILIHDVQLMLKNNRDLEYKITWYGAYVSLSKSYIALRSWVDQECVDAMDLESFYTQFHDWSASNKPAENDWISTIFQMLNSPLTWYVAFAMLAPAAFAMTQARSDSRELVETQNGFSENIDEPSLMTTNFEQTCSARSGASRPNEIKLREANDILDQWVKTALLRKANSYYCEILEKIDLVNDHQVVIPCDNSLVYLRKTRKATVYINGANNVTLSLGIQALNATVIEFVMTIGARATKFDIPDWPSRVNMKVRNIENHTQILIPERDQSLILKNTLPHLLCFTQTEVDMATNKFLVPPILLKPYYNMIRNIAPDCSLVTNVNFTLTSPARENLSFILNNQIDYDPQFTFVTNSPLITLKIRGNDSLAKFGILENYRGTVTGNFLNDVYTIVAKPEALRHWFTQKRIWLLPQKFPGKILLEFSVKGAQKPVSAEIIFRQTQQLLTMECKVPMQPFLVPILHNSQILQAIETIRIDPPSSYISFVGQGTNKVLKLAPNWRNGGRQCANIYTITRNETFVSQQCFDIHVDWREVLNEVWRSDFFYMLWNITLYLSTMVFVILKLNSMHDFWVRQRMQLTVNDLDIPIEHQQPMINQLLAKRYYTVFGKTSPLARAGIRSSWPGAPLRLAEQEAQQSLEAFNIDNEIDAYLNEERALAILNKIPAEHHNAIPRLNSLMIEALQNFKADKNYSTAKSIAEHYKHNKYKRSQSLRELLEEFVQNFNFKEEMDYTKLQSELRFRFHSILLMDLPVYTNVRSQIELSGHNDVLNECARNLEELKSFHHQIQTGEILIPDPLIDNFSFAESLNGLIEMRKKIYFDKLRLGMNFETYQCLFDLCLRENEYYFECKTKRTIINLGAPSFMLL